MHDPVPARQLDQSVAAVPEVLEMTVVGTTGSQPQEKGRRLKRRPGKIWPNHPGAVAPPLLCEEGNVVRTSVSSCWYRRFSAAVDKGGIHCC